MNNKICEKCHENKNIESFYLRKSSNKYDSVCRNCLAIDIKNKRNNNQTIMLKHKESMKKYYDNNREKLNIKNKEYHNKNKELLNKKSKEYYSLNAEKMKQDARIYKIELKDKIDSGLLKKPDIKDKQCTKCKLIKNVLEFTFRKNRNVYESVCKLCNRDRERLRRELFKNQINERRKEIKKPLTVEQKIKNSLRKRLYDLVTNRHVINKYVVLLGCTKKFLIEWFEYNFKLDENLDIKWDNHGSRWQIDHVRPCTIYNMENQEHQKECFHWTNLSPVLTEHNLTKGQNISLDDEKRQIDRIQEFLKLTEQYDKKEYKYSLGPIYFHLCENIDRDQV